MDDRTQLSNTECELDFKPVDTQSTIIPLSQISKIATEQLVTVKAKVMQLSRAKAQQSASRGTLKKQEGMIADTNGSTKITFWENFTDICQEGKTYIFKHLKVKKYAGTKYLGIPYNEGCDIQETDDLVGETAQIDEQQQLTTLEFQGSVKGLTSLSKNFAFAGCHFSIKNTSTEPLITCTNCNLEQKRASCPSSWFARLLIMSSAIPPKKVYVTANNQQLLKLAELANIDLNTCSKTDLTMALLDMPPIKVTYNSLERKITDVDFTTN